MLLIGCDGSVQAEQDASPSADTAVFDSAPVDLFVLDPWSTRLVIDTSTTPLRESSVTFRARIRRDDGSETDVTSSTTFTVDDPSVGRFDGPVFSTTSSAERVGAFSGVLARYQEHRVGASVLVIYARRGGPSGDPITTDPYFIYHDGMGDDPAQPSGLLTFEGHGSDHSVQIVTDAGDPQFIRRVEALSAGRSDRGCPMSTTRDANGDGVHETFVAPAAGSRICYLVVPNESALADRSRTREPAFFRAWVDGVDAAGRERRAVTFVVMPRPGP